MNTESFRLHPIATNETRDISAELIVGILLNFVDTFSALLTAVFQRDGNNKLILIIISRLYCDMTTFSSQRHPSHPKTPS